MTYLLPKRSGSVGASGIISDGHDHREWIAQWAQIHPTIGRLDGIAVARDVKILARAETMSDGLARRRLQFYPTSFEHSAPPSHRPVFRPNGPPKRGSSRIPFALDDRRVQGSRRRHDFQSIGRGGRRGRDRRSDVVVDVGPKSLLTDEVVAWFRRSETRSRNQFHQNFRSFILMSKVPQLVHWILRIRTGGRSPPWQER